MSCPFLACLMARRAEPGRSRRGARPDLIIRANTKRRIATSALLARPARPARRYEGPSRRTCAVASRRSLDRLANDLRWWPIGAALPCCSMRPGFPRQKGRPAPTRRGVANSQMHLCSGIYAAAPSVHAPCSVGNAEHPTSVCGARHPRRPVGDQNRGLARGGTVAGARLNRSSPHLHGLISGLPSGSSLQPTFGGTAATQVHRTERACFRKFATFLRRSRGPKGGRLRFGSGAVTLRGAGGGAPGAGGEGGALTGWAGIGTIAFRVRTRYSVQYAPLAVCGPASLLGFAQFPSHGRRPGAFNGRRAGAGSSDLRPARLCDPFPLNQPPHRPSSARSLQFGPCIRRPVWEHGSRSPLCTDPRLVALRSSWPYEHGLLSRADWYPVITRFGGLPRDPSCRVS